MNVRILGNVSHNGNVLEQYEIYDLNEADAKGLIEAGVAEEVDGEKKANPEPEVTPRPEADPDAPYVAEAVIEPKKKAKLAEEGKLDDPKPVVEPTHEADPIEVDVVEGEPKPEASGKPQE